MKLFFNVKNIIALIILLGFIASLVLFITIFESSNSVEFRTNETIFQIKKDDVWEDFIIKGVNLGAGKPGYFPGEMGITKDEYLRWFKQIAEMNSNTIRVYTILSPGFYEALYEHNLSNPNPLYVFHGVWINEQAIEEHNNAYHDDITEDFKSEISNLIRVLHGDNKIKNRTGHASGIYTHDVSKYIMGYILGIELDTTFVTTTNVANPDVTGFDGKYLYTKNASPHESWLAEMGDYTIGYEQEKYGVQKPISWVNWLTTDPLWHSSEPDKKKEDAVSVDTEHIFRKDTFTAGLFASYHIYPYYPEFMMHQPEYTSYIDEDGKVNTYKAYLLELNQHHNVPVLVAEFGLPSSRGNTHSNLYSGYNQGHLTEKEQGDYVADMFGDIISAGYAGGLVFTWQDEWFKRSWNTMDLDISDRRSFWCNNQVSEQHYGLMAFDTGAVRPFCQVDGDVSEWTQGSYVSQTDDYTLYAESDEAFLYLILTDKTGNVDKKKYVIGVDSIADQGNTSYKSLNIKFEKGIDTAIVIDGKDRSAINVDAYYDPYYRLYSSNNTISRNLSFERNDTGIFNPTRLILSNALLMPLTNETIAPLSYETGKLKYGNSNPSATDYDSLSDFCFSKDNKSIEIRIPWQLLNIADPSSNSAMGNLYTSDVFSWSPVKLAGLAFEVCTPTQTENHLIGYYSWDSWNEVTFHERLKQSYYILQQEFAKYQ